MVQRVQQMLHESRVSKFTFVLSLRSSKYALACKRVFADERVPMRESWHVIIQCHRRRATSNLLSSCSHALEVKPQCDVPLRMILRHMVCTPSD